MLLSQFLNMCADATFIIVCPIVGVWALIELGYIAKYLHQIMLNTQYRR